MLSLAVPWKIIEIIERGGVTNADCERMKTYQEHLTAHGDDLLFRSTKHGGTAEQLDQLADVMAVMSFLPGGISVFGERYAGNAMLANLTYRRYGQTPPAGEQLSLETPPAAGERSNDTDETAHTLSVLPLVARVCLPRPAFSRSLPMRARQARTPPISEGTTS